MDVSDETYDEFTDILGAYALDAVDLDERERIELHLAECPRCRAEVAEHREVAAVLSQTGAPAPEGVWDRIAAELSPPAPPLRITFAPESIGDEPSAPVVALDSRRRRFNARTMVAVVAVAACIVAILGVVTVGQSQRLNKLETALDDRSLATLANDVEAHAAIDATLTGEAGSAQAVVGENGQGFLIMDDVAPPADGDVYQLWGKVDDVVLSLGTFGGESNVVPFSVDPQRLDDVELFAVTAEKAPGVLASKNAALMAGEV